METKNLLIAAGALGVGYLVWRSMSSSSPSTSTSTSSSPSSGRSASLQPSGCYGGLPRAVGSTDFDGMPDDFRTVFEEPTKLKPSDVTSLTVDFAADAAEALADQARCAGYTAAADKLTAKAAEIRTWTT